MYAVPWGGGRWARVVACWEGAVSEVRKLCSQGGTHIVSLPLGMVRAMGVVSGDRLLLEQPFSSTIIVSGMLRTRESKGVEVVRAMGWADDRARTDLLSDRVGVMRCEEGVKCALCRRWQASKRVLEFYVCRWCEIELANVVEFRMHPCQMEIEMA